MGKADRKMKRKNVVSAKSPLTKKSLAEMQKLPELVEEILKANETLSDENDRIKKVVGEILEEHANKIAALERKVLNLELNSGDASNPGMVKIEGDGDEKPIHPPTT